MKNGEPESDDELIEYVREQMQLALERALQAYAAGATADEFLDNDVLPRTTVRVLASDLREIGSFVLDGPMPPDMLRHWVYRHLKTEDVHVMGVKTRAHLERAGFADVDALVSDPKDVN